MDDSTGRKGGARKPHPNPPDAATLRAIYCDRGLSTRQAGKHFGVSKFLIAKWLNRHGIPLRETCTVARTPTPAPDPDSPETWVPIPDHLGYEASDQGRIGSRWKQDGTGPTLESRRILTGSKLKYGHLYVRLQKSPGNPSRLVHHLILESFGFARPSGRHECRHLDGNSANNRLGNLKWGTPDENAADKYAHGLTTNSKNAMKSLAVRFGDDFMPIEAILPRETWKRVAGNPGYEVSSFGRAGSYLAKGTRGRIGETRRILKPSLVQGTPYVGLRGRSKSVSRLVIETFSGPAPPGKECRHLDGNPENNHIANLRWSEHRENIRDKILHGTQPRGSQMLNAKLTEVQAREIRRRRAAGESGVSLAVEYGVSRSTISMVHRGLSWNYA